MSTAKAVLAITMAIAALTSCGSDGEDRSADAARSTSAPAPAPSSTSGPSSTSLSAPTPVNDPQPCLDQATYSTSPDWRIDQVPDGFALDRSRAEGTYVQHQQSSPHSSLTTYLLVELDDDGHVVADLAVQRWGDLEQFEPESATSAGFAVVEQGANSVRGHEGHVVRVINRGDLAGQAEARWTERGVGWVARSTALDLDALAAALEPLVLAEDVTDPHDRFTELGRSRYSAESRRTRIFLAGADSPDAVTLTFDIGSPADGDTGITYLHPSDSTVSVVGGRTIVDGERSTRTTLSDGSTVSIEERRTDGSPLALNAAERLALIDHLERVDAEAWWSTDQTRPEGLCREDR